MNAHVLLNLLNELRKRDKMRGLPSILFPLRNELFKFNDTGARMLGSIYHMTLTYLFKSYFWRGNVRVSSFHNVLENLYITCGLSILMHGVFSLPDATSYDKCNNDQRC